MRKGILGLVVCFALVSCGKISERRDENRRKKEEFNANYKCKVMYLNGAVVSIGVKEVGKGEVKWYPVDKEQLLYENPQIEECTRRVKKSIKKIRKRMKNF